MAGSIEAQNPGIMPRPAVSFQGALAAGTAVTNGVAVSETIAIAGSARFMCRVKTSGNGALDASFAIRNAAGVVTNYASGNPTQVAVTGGTETYIAASTYGENYLTVTFTPSADGTITYCDFSQV